MKKHLVSLAVVSGFAAAALAAPAESPFAVKPLSAGYQLAQAEKQADGSCGAAKKADGSCGAGKGAGKAADKKKDGKCGEAKCGADKKGGK